MQYRASLEDAHPPIKRPIDRPIGAAMVRAYQRAARQGYLRLPVPESIRADVLSIKRRHSFVDSA